MVTPENHLSRCSKQSNVVDVVETNACEDAAVEAEGMAMVNDEVVEVRLQPIRGPALFGGPSVGSVRDR